MANARTSGSLGGLVLLQTVKPKGSGCKECTSVPSDVLGRERVLADRVHPLHIALLRVAFGQHTLPADPESASDGGRSALHLQFNWLLGLCCTAAPSVLISFVQLPTGLKK